MRFIPCIAARSLGPQKSGGSLSRAAGFASVALIVCAWGSAEGLSSLKTLSGMVEPSENDADSPTANNPFGSPHTHPHPHPQSSRASDGWHGDKGHPLPGSVPPRQPLTHLDTTQRAAVGGQEVQRALPPNSDFAQTDSASWPKLSSFYQEYGPAFKAVELIQAANMNAYWKPWKQRILDIYFDDNLGTGEGRRNTTAGHCRASTACEDRCQERCLLNSMLAHCAAGECAASCSAPQQVCGGESEPCKYNCSGICLPACIRSKLHSLKSSIVGCMPTHLRKCEKSCEAVRQSHPGRPKDFLVCHTKCVSAGISRCLAPHTGHCAERCGRHSCVQGRCVCPGLLSGSDECMDKPWNIIHEVPELTKNCFQTFSDPQFQLSPQPGRGAGKLVSILEERTRSLMQTYSQYLWYNENITSATPAIKPDLKHMADWTSCALIGSSGSLIGQNLGPVIDKAHTAWIRFNDAPTIGFEEHVGSRTTLRIQNNLYCGFNEGKEEMCAPYTKFSVRAKCHPTEGRSCPVVAFSDALHNAVRMFMQPEFFHSPEIDVNDYHWNTTGHVDTSAGFFGTVLALHLCGEVHIYGFDQNPTHYYNKKPSATIKPFETRHGWDAERHCLKAYQEVFPHFRILEAHQLQEHKAMLLRRHSIASLDSVL